MAQSRRKPTYTRIPTQLNEKQFQEFVLPHLSMPKRGPKCKIGYWKVFNCILKVLHTGVQWEELPIERQANGKPEIHYTGIFKNYARWADDESLQKAFDASVGHLKKKTSLMYLS